MSDQKLQNARVDTLAVRNQDFHGRQIKNASDATDPQDYVTLKQLKDANKQTLQAAVGSSVMTQGTFERVYSLFKFGTLAIESDCCERSVITETSGASLVRVDVKGTPIGADLVIAIYQVATLWMTLTLVAGTFSISATGVQLSAALPASIGNYWRIDLTAVGTTFPGSDLTVTIV